MNSHKFNILWVLPLLLSSCSVSKFLGPQELLLSSNKIQIQGTSNFENKLDLSEQLSTLYKQNPNRNFFLFIPREWLYYKYANRKKQNWITKTLARQGEKPAIVDTLLCRATQNNIHNYLYNQGFFNATESYSIKKMKHKAQVIYQVQPGDRYLINDIQFIADDPAVLELLQKNQGGSFLQAGRPLDNSLFQNEKARISELMFNHGYIEFNPLYIQTLEADTVHLKANIKLRVLNPEGKSQHPIYLVNRIEVNRNYNPNDSISTSQSIWYDSIQLPDESRFQLIRPKVIASKVKFRTGDIANKSLVDETYGQLSKLGIYRFVSIEAQKDSMLNNQLNYKILLTPYKRWVFDYGTDLNYTSIKTASKTLFGISGFVHLKNRNLFRGAESFSTKVEIGTELNLFKINDFNSLNIHYSNELSLPAFHDLSGTWHLAKSIIRPFRKYTTPPDSRTNIKIGLDYENLVRLYQYTSINANVEYEWQIKRRKRVSLHTIGFFLYLPNTTSEFDTLLASNPFLEKSFKGRRLFTSFFMDNLTFYYQSKIKNKFQHAFIHNLNFSGIEVQTLNFLYNKAFGKKDTFSIGDFEFSKFLRAEMDYRIYYTHSERSRLAARIAIGAVSPFGSSNSVPYIKQFYVGGPQSLRGWNIRELGPGNLNLSSSVKDRQTYYAAGDVKIEGSIEYRFDVIWRFKGAFFVDAGNIWLLPRSENRGQPGFLNSNLLSEIALGTGMGLRVDLSYFLFRVDIGFKLRNPYKGENGSNWIYSASNPVSVKNLFKNSTLHLALDYPF